MMESPTMEINSEVNKENCTHKEQKQLLKVIRMENKKKMEEEAGKERKEKALKGMQYLSSISEKFTIFFNDVINSNHKNHKRPRTIANNPAPRRNNILQPTLRDLKDVQQMENFVINEPVKHSVDLTSKKLIYLEGGKLRPYQVEGVTWMAMLFENGLNGILADEMGLGKTIQVIALLCYMYEIKVPGPHLVVAPLSTIPNWQMEFKRFAPRIPVVVFHGSHEQRRSLYADVQKKYVLGGDKVAPVVITSYQIPLFEQHFFNRFTWQYIVVDEGHRLKNHMSKLSIILRGLKSSNRLLLTGTPLQNNMTELWALLNFLLPQFFNNIDTFDSLFLLDDIKDLNKIAQQEKSTNTISIIHKVLSPFMLRRMKDDVLTENVPIKEVIIYCPMSKLQKELYTYIIERNIAKLQNVEEVEVNVELNEQRAKRRCTLNRRSYYEVENMRLNDFIAAELAIKEIPVQETIKQHFIQRLTMTNTMMMFKKVVDHPYLVKFPLDPKSETRQLLVDENLVADSGKIMVLDAILPKLKAGRHKVLIFSTLVMMLDIVEEFLIMRGYKYRRLDGSISLSQRALAIEEFNNHPNVFIFLISTRAGGLGLNLTAADTVIFIDRDWNPQIDIQAQSRCHRIGQDKPVMVYTLVTKNTIDERIIMLGHLKKRLEKLVIKNGKFSSLLADERGRAENDFLELLRLLNSEETNDTYNFSTPMLDRLLDRSELYEKMKRRSVIVK